MLDMFLLSLAVYGDWSESPHYDGVVSAEVEQHMRFMRTFPASKSSHLSGHRTAVQET